jgi:DNA-binding beta-propeller fold protein YncE
VTPIDTSTGTVRKAINAGEYSCSIAITPDGRTAYVSAFTGTSPRGLTGIVTPVRLPCGTPGPPVILGARTGATDIAITPDGTAAYVTALENIPHMPGIVLPISTVTGTAGRLIRVGDEPLSVAFAP